MIEEDRKGPPCQSCRQETVVCCGARVKLTFCSFILVSSILLCSSSLRLFCSASLSRRAASEIDQYSENRRGEEWRGEDSPIVPAFLWCALLPPSLQALLMLLVAGLELLPSSPPDSDSKLDCMNRSLLPTWSTLSMLRKVKNQN